MNNEFREKFLPIGTVVMLKGGTKRAMITGFCSIAQENSNKMYDYSGCIYPEGYISSNQVCLFDHSQIEKVYYTGYIDEEEINFKNKLNTLLQQVNIDDILNSDTFASNSVESSVSNISSNSNIKEPNYTMEATKDKTLTSVNHTVGQNSATDIPVMPINEMNENI